MSKDPKKPAEKLLEPLVEAPAMEALAPPAVSLEQAAVFAARDEALGEAPQLLALDAFCRFKFGGKNFDQSAGFIAHCRLRKMRKLPMAEWEVALESFMTRKVGV